MEGLTCKTCPEGKITALVMADCWLKPWLIGEKYYLHVAFRLNR